MKYNEKDLLIIWDSIKDGIVFTKKLDKSKLLKQLEFFKEWIRLGCNSYLTACTRFGKTMVGIIAIKRMNLTNLKFKTIVIVPTRNLYDDWMSETGHVNIFNLKNIEVYVINTYALNDKTYECTLLVIDEIHRAANEDSEYFNKVIDKTTCNYKLGLSATIDDEKKHYLAKYGMVSCGHVSLQEAELKGWVSTYDVYNFGLEFSSDEERDLNDYWDSIHNGNFAKFEFDWNIASGCMKGNDVRHYNKDLGISKTGTQWRYWYANRMGWNTAYGNDHEWSPSSIKKYAGLWGKAMRERKSLLHNCNDKVQIIKKIHEHLNLPTIVFSESISFADKVSFLLEEDGRSYHSQVNAQIYSNSTLKKLIAVGFKTDDNKTMFKMINSGMITTYRDLKKNHKQCTKLSGKELKQKIKDDLEKGVFKVLSTVRSLDEGFDSDVVRIGIVASSKSKALVDTQRNGRILNYKDGKKSIFINLYMVDTQDEKWLKSRQYNVASGKINWITEINQIEKV